MTKDKFTKRQKSNWLLFEDIRKEGVVNMVNAGYGSAVTGMTREEWMFTLKNYGELKEHIDAEQQESKSM